MKYLGNLILILIDNFCGVKKSPLFYESLARKIRNLKLNSCIAKTKPLNKKILTVFLIFIFAAVGAPDDGTKRLVMLSKVSILNAS